MRVKISDVRVGNRIRRSLGDINALKESMRRLGLLEPILIDPQNRLVAGYRRLEAAKMLGWESIEARLVDIKDRKERLIIEADENTTRKDFTPDEMTRAEKLMERHGRTGFLWKILAWLMDLIERVFKR